MSDGIRGFSGGMEGFRRKVARMTHDVFVKTCELTHQSVVDGSPLTGAPGQPVDTGTLKNSWVPGFESPTTWATKTNIVYAPIIEDNVRGATLRSAVGGFHSVKLTAAHFEHLVAAAVKAVTP